MGIGIFGGQIGIDAVVVDPRWVSKIDLPEVLLEPLARGLSFCLRRNGSACPA